MIQNMVKGKCVLKNIDKKSDTGIYNEVTERLLRIFTFILHILHSSLLIF